MLYGENNQRTLDESTQGLFEAIDNENLEAFKQALKEGADVNAFDEEGMTPLMFTANIYITSNNQPTLEKMAKLLIQNRSININAQSKQPVYEERQKRDRHGRLVYLFCGQEVAEVRPGYYIYCNNGRSVDNVDDPGERRYFNSYYDGVKEKIRTSEIQKNTALHIACQVGAKDIVKILLTHPGINTDVRNCEDKDPKDCIARGFEDTIKLEFEKAQKANELLGALSSGNIYQAKRLLNQELNPNCWKRTYNEEIETPLSLIIESCLRGITQDNEEVLTKLLKHKDLDFSQIKPIQDIEKNPWVKQIIEQAIKERLTGTINRKDLDDVKELVKDNCFINRAIVTAALRNASEPTESIKNYLNEKFPASVEQPVANTNNIPAGFERAFQEVVIELEKIKAQLAETEQELDSAKQEKLSQQARISALTNQVARLTEERDRLSSENRRLRSNKNEKSSQAISSGRKLSNYASACFILLGVYTVVACLVIEDYPGIISAFFTAVA
ncbi:MAG: hypothetical protein O7149_03400, partial [Wolbachia endosymbiont of Hylaeus sinuatus]|nr:hypothetical protein [Wolbachia endosymbiont of Hylaeus sinuatus]